MTDHTASSKISRLDVIATGARRRWTLEEKLRIVAESYGGARLVSVTAWRNGLSASQLFTWRRQGRLVEADGVPVFAPAIVGSESSVGSASSLPEHVVSAKNVPSPPCSMVTAGRIEIVLMGGSRVIVDAGVDVAALHRVLDVLERR